MDTSQDEELNRELKAVGYFKFHLSLFIIVIAILWILWAIAKKHSGNIWPMFPSFGWGFILLIHFLGVYRMFRKRKNNTD